jgi:type I restriction-modification system DNA methylase subunit
MTEQNPNIQIIHTAPPEIISLVDRFAGQRVAYKSGRYNETELRRDFLDPLFEALGWDMTNRKNYSEKYREVIHEISVEVEGHAKAADYSFQSGGNILFFVEAKKPAVNIETNPEPAFQIRRYAWSAKVPISIVTDFEQLVVYDCRTKPIQGDPAYLGRVKLFTFTDYITKWDEIYNLFSYQAVHQGSLDQFAVSLKGKRGTADVDDDFLKEMERWREELAQNIALRNTLTQREINTSVQTTIDRIIFLRICEERGIESEDTLRNATDGKQVYEDLLVLFKQADRKYNSGLFHFEAEKGQSSYPDTLTPNLKIDDKVLKDILANLYYPKCPYAFNYFSADILGQVYERFLGKVIRLTASGHQTKVEEKPEVRKAGGVYYTPTYIVDYIVKNTVGELLKDRDPESLKTVPLRVLDPACGSGSFLIGAYQYLLDWYLDWYVQHDPSKWSRGKNPPIFEVRNGWQLTMEKKKAILTSHIFGVDIDAQAVEVTKLSLLLKVVENPGQLTLLGERILPDLGANIKCGNSLIGPDFYDDQQQGLFDTDEQYRVNAFDWHAAFPEVLRNGGFDAVIGNPPYGAEFQNISVEYLQIHFETCVWRGESYLLFVEKAIRLLRNHGLFGYIIPDTYLNLGFTKVLRDFLLKNTRLREIVVLPSTVFSSASVDTTLLFTEKVEMNNVVNDCKVLVKTFEKKINLSSIEQPNRSFEISTSVWFKNGSFLVQSNIDELNVILKIEEQKTNLSDLTELFYGIKVYQIGKGKPQQTKLIRDTKPFTSSARINENFLPFFDGKHIGRYELLWKENNWLHYGMWLAEPRFPKKFEGEKLLIRKIVGQTLIATYIAETSYCNTLLYVLKLNPKSEIGYKYLLGILNSKMIGWFYRNKFQINSTDTFPQILIRDIQQFKIAIPNKTRHDRMVTLVETMLTLHKQSAAARLPDEKERLQRQIQTTDRQIDKLVYDLYNLTPAEIAIVEAS